MEGWAKHPAKAEGTFTESFLTFKMSPKNGVVAGTCRSSMYLWDTTQSPSLETNLLYSAPSVIVFDNAIITALHADSDFIIVGDNYGTLTLLNNKGHTIYRLNANESQGPKTMDINSLPFNQLSAIFKDKVNEIVRVSRWVLASFASGSICLYDIFTPELSTPVDVLPVKASAGAPAVTGFSFCIAGQKVYCLAHPPVKDPKSGLLRLPLEAWTPDVPYGSFTECALRKSTWLKPPVPMLAGMVSKLCKSNVMRDQEHEEVLKNAKAAEHFLKECKNDVVRAAPFLLIRRMVHAYDEFEHTVTTLERGSIKEKHKKAFFAAAAEFFRAIKTVKDVIEFCAPPPLPPPDGAPLSVVRKKSSVAIPVQLQTSPASLSPSSLSPPPPPLPPAAIQAMDDKDSDSSSVASSSLQSTLTREDRINEMLAELDITLMGLHNKIGDVIESFDRACNADPPGSDNAKALALLSMYTRLYQFGEDFKEVGKDVAELRDVTTNSTWHGTGGNYSIPMEIKPSK